MTLLKAGLLAGGGTSLLIGLALGLALVGKEEVFPGREVVSPTGEYVARFYGIGAGGGPGALDEYVGVLRAGADFDPRVFVLRMRLGYEVCLTWTGDSQLRIEYPQDAVIEERLEVVRFESDIHVLFTPRPSVDGMIEDGQCDGERGLLRLERGGWDRKQ